MYKGVFHSLPQQNMKEKLADTVLTDSSIPVQECSSTVDNITSSEQAGAWCEKVNYFSIEHAAQEPEDSKDTHCGLKRYKKVGTATTIDTSDTLDLDTSESTTTGSKVTFDSPCQTNLSTIDPETGSEDEKGDTEPTLEK